MAGSSLGGTFRLILVKHVETAMYKNKMYVMDADCLRNGVSKITCGFSKINCGMESWANGNSPKSVVGRNRWILNKKMVKKSGNRVTFGCLIWYKTYFLYYLNFGPFTACFLYGPLVLSVRKQTSFHGLGTAKMAAFFRCEKRKRFRICSKFP